MLWASSGSVWSYHATTNRAVAVPPFLIVFSPVQSEATAHVFTSSGNTNRSDTFASRSPLLAMEIS